MVSMCLVKDQTKRPTAEKLLKHSFFKGAKSPENTVKNLLAGLAPLWDRVKQLQLKDAAQLALRKMPSAEEEALSQSEYKRGVSAWNFDIEDMKRQASLIQEDEELAGVKEDKMVKTDPSISKPETGKAVVLKENADNRTVINGSAMTEIREITKQNQIVGMDLPNISSQGKVDLYEKGELRSGLTSTTKRDAETNHSSGLVRKVKTFSGPVAPVNMMAYSSSDKGRILLRSDNGNQPRADKYKQDVRKAPNFSGPLMLPNCASANSLSAPTAPVKSLGGHRDMLRNDFLKSKVQIKGRFSVTSENVDIVKDIPICTAPIRSSQIQSASVGNELDPNQMSIKDIGSSRLPASILVPHLQNLYQQTSFQRDLIDNLLNSLQQTDQADAMSSAMSSLAVNPKNDLLVEPDASEREQLLLTKISEMQARVSSLTDELTAEKVKHAQLEQEISDANSERENRKIIEESGESCYS